MKDLKHTKGNWRSYLMNVFVECKEPLGLKPITSILSYSNIQDFGTTDEETEANAKLMSAAPDMLEVLMSLENDDNNIPLSIWEMRNKAIEKAINGDIPNYLSALANER
jgi:AmiR/NasT family two-component response regulator